MGVITAAADHGPWTIESSLFNGREPDDNRWDSVINRAKNGDEAAA